MFSVGIPSRTLSLHIALWMALWLFWIWVSRHNHPTLLINAVATALLLTAYAAAVYFNWLTLVPRLWRHGHFGAYWPSLLLAMTVLTFAVVLAITRTYDVLWGQDPARFGFWTNFGLDFVGMALHLLGAAELVWVVRRRRRRSEKPFF